MNLIVEWNHLALEALRAVALGKPKAFQNTIQKRCNTDQQNDAFVGPLARARYQGPWGPRAPQKNPFTSFASKFGSGAPSTTPPNPCLKLPRTSPVAPPLQQRPL